MESLIDLQSLYGYSANSPFRSNPYLDIQTPEGLIDMSNTPIDLLGVDNTGMVKKMKAKSKNPYKFKGDIVREIPVGNPYQKGGSITAKQAFDFLFSEDEEEEKVTHTAPSVAEVEQEQMNQQPQADSSYETAMQIATQGFGNPYRRTTRNVGEILSSGMQGAQNIGARGREIYGQLSSDLGYNPVANSIYRTQAQQNQLIAKGIGAKNSYHLTGDAIDLKPQDWHKLSNEQQQYYRMNYDVVYHNNHYHIEPK